MTVIIKLVEIAVIVTTIIDITGIISSIENALSRWLNVRVRLGKPFNCS